MTKNNLEDLHIIPKLKNPNNKKPITPKDFLEKIENDKIKREEREKLKLYEKLQAQTLGKKQKLSSLGTTNTTLISNANNTKNSKRLIDNLNSIKNTNLLNTSEFTNNKTTFNKKLLDDTEFRKTIKNKIEIDCTQSSELQINSEKMKKDLNEEKADKDFMDSLSNEKRKFFLFKTRELYEFLQSIKLLRYIEVFMEDGIEDLECILGK